MRPHVYIWCNKYLYPPFLQNGHRVSFNTEYLVGGQQLHPCFPIGIWKFNPLLSSSLCWTGVMLGIKIENNNFGLIMDEQNCIRNLQKTGEGSTPLWVSVVHRRIWGHRMHTHFKTPFITFYFYRSAKLGGKLWPGIAAQKCQSSHVQGHKGMHA